MGLHILDFDGYLDDSMLDSFPETSGIYCVFARTKSLYGNTVPKRLIYIGKAIDLYDRHHTHEYHDDWLKLIDKRNEELCYNYAKVAMNELDIVENALIYYHQPLFNINCKSSFNHNSAIILCEGCIGTLQSVFCVNRAA